MKERLHYIDIAKGIGIILVVWFHTSGVTHLISNYPAIDFMMYGRKNKNKCCK
jgi:fucose 4-O-acetylase-like acetyltransferase